MNQSTADIKYITANGQEIAYRDVGDGPLFLMLHGGEGDHQIFLPVLERLGKNFRTVVYDQRDCGATRAADAPYDLNDLADDAAALITTLGYERAHVLGHSAGGLVAQVLATRWPQRVDRLVLEVTQRASPEIWLDNTAFRKRTEVIEREGFRGLAALFTTPRYAAEHPEFVDSFEEQRISHMAHNTARRGAAMRDIPIIDHKAIGAPTLVLGAAEDALIGPDILADLADALSSPMMAVMPDVGHLGVIQEPDTFCNYVEQFLTRRLDQE